MNRKHTVEKKPFPATGPYAWTGCELTSPVLADHDYAIEIENVCRVLNRIRIHLNETTAVHVHVGPGNEPFSLLTVKRFATLYWFTEEAILQLHHPSRYANGHCLRSTRHSMLAGLSQEYLETKLKYSEDNMTEMAFHIPAHNMTSLEYAHACYIWACSTIDEVARLMSNRRHIILSDGIYFDRGWLIGLKRFSPAGETGREFWTFEWRHMSGSLNADHINQWVKVYGAFTHLCRTADSATFYLFLKAIMEKGHHYNGYHLLSALSIDNQIFGNIRAAWARDPDFFNGDRGPELFVTKW
ncbi:hypothetical protein F4678DRAFT_450260 [Xylaria arbuscula]|nr:hypothetical protein F4678DRAFT_450260 [Xylaria arbuscula]